MPSEEFLNLKEVAKRVRRSPTWIWEKEKADEFPHGRRAGDRNIFWLESEISSWMRSLPSRHEKRVDAGADVGRRRVANSEVVKTTSTPRST